VPNFQYRASADTESRMDNRRIVEDNMLLARRCTVLVNQLVGAVGQVFRQLFWIGDGGGCTDKDRIAAVKFTDPLEPADNMWHMCAEYAFVSMQFIDDYIMKVLENRDPFCMMRQNSGMQHVRIGHDNLPCFTHLGPDCRRSVSVVGIG